MTRGPRSRRPSAEERRRRFVTAVAIFLTLAVIASLIAVALSAKPDPAATTSATPTAPTGTEATPTASQSTDTTTDCVPEPSESMLGSETLLGFEDADQARLVDGRGELSADTETRIDGAAALRIEVSGREPAVVRALLPAPIDIQHERTVGLWLRRNDRVPIGTFDLRIRLSAGGLDAFELSLDPISTRTAGDWCFVQLPLPRLQVIGRPDPSRIEAIEVRVPAASGKGGRPAVVWLDSARY